MICTIPLYQVLFHFAQVRIINLIRVMGLLICHIKEKRYVRMILLVLLEEGSCCIIVMVLEKAK